jgi:hypothetical protein
VAPGARPLLKMLASCIPDEIVLDRHEHGTWCDLSEVAGALRQVKHMLCDSDPKFKMEFFNRSMQIYTDAATSSGMCGFADGKGLVTTVDPFLHESWPQIVRCTRQELELKSRPRSWKCMPST